jgi:hypothetical protein
VQILSQLNGRLELDAGRHDTGALHSAQGTRPVKASKKSTLASENPCGMTGKTRRHPGPGVSNKSLNAICWCFTWRSHEGTGWQVGPGDPSLQGPVGTPVHRLEEAQEVAPVPGIAVVRVALCENGHGQVKRPEIGTIIGGFENEDGCLMGLSDIISERPTRRRWLPFLPAL